MPKPWSPTTWRSLEAKQMPKYDSLEDVEAAENIIAKQAPLVFAGEV
ncbi:unnamed protein product, partial [Discosporangium mesarthrocarpum]